ncbi:MAG: hypothetical protein V7698_14110 [Paracoccaceae bacterium]|jgi:hypothetical protein|nr:hypothetical protein [Paracoccaceae bacterium]
MAPRKPTTTEKIRRMNQRFLVRVRRKVPPGLRLVAGLLLILGGVLGFLPVLGFWMIPLGLGVAALDVKPLIAWVRGRKDGRWK